MTIQGLIQQMQGWKEDRKRRVMVVASAIIMLIVILIWVTYFDSVVSGRFLSSTASVNSSDDLSFSASIAGAVRLGWEGIRAIPTDIADLWQATNQSEIITPKIQQ